MQLVKAIQFSELLLKLKDIFQKACFIFYYKMLYACNHAYITCTQSPFNYVSLNSIILSQLQILVYYLFLLYVSLSLDVYYLRIILTSSELSWRCCFLWLHSGFCDSRSLQTRRAGFKSQISLSRPFTDLSSFNQDSF